MNKNLPLNSNLIADGVGSLTEHLQKEGSELGGGRAVDVIKLDSNASAEAYLRENPINRPGFYLQRLSSLATLQRANGLLAGRVILHPQTINGKIQLCPSIISPEGLQNPNRMKVISLDSVYNPAIGATADLHFNLSYRAQSETAGMGEHNTGKPGTEPEHLLTIYGASRDPQLASEWTRGMHPNHAVRQQGTVVDYSLKKGMLATRHIDPQNIPTAETTVYFADERELLWKQHEHEPTPQQIPHIDLLWHDKIIDPTGKALSGDFEMSASGERHSALEVMQGLGFISLHENPDALQRAFSLIGAEQAANT